MGLACGQLKDRGYVSSILDSLTPVQSPARGRYSINVSRLHKDVSQHAMVRTALFLSLFPVSRSSDRFRQRVSQSLGQNFSRLTSREASARLSERETAQLIQQWVYVEALDAACSFIT